MDFLLFFVPEYLGKGCVQEEFLPREEFLNPCFFFLIAGRLWEKFPLLLRSWK